MYLRVSLGAYSLPVFVAVLIGVALRICFVIATPFNKPEEVGKLSAYYDEAAHVEYTRHILQTGKLPSKIAPVTTFSTGSLPTFENYQSPISYILHAATCKLFQFTDSRDIALVGRWLSLLYMFVAIAIAAAVSSSLGTSMSPEARSVFLIFLALSGVFVRFSTQAGNEMLAWVAIGWTSLAFINHDRHSSPRNYYWMIISFIIGIYVKVSVLVVTPLIILTLVKLWPTHRERVVIGCLYIIAALTPLAAYNFTTFGSIIPLASGFGHAVWRIPDISSALYGIRSTIFPWSELWRNWLGLTLFAPAIVLLGWAFLSVLRNSKQMSWASSILCTSFLAFIWLNFHYDQAEGRYLFAAWPALMTSVDLMPSSLRSPWLWISALLLPYLLFVI